MIQKVYYCFIAISCMIPSFLIDAAVNSFMPGLENSVLTLFSTFISIFFDSIVLTGVSLLIALYLFVRHKERKGIFFFVVMFFSGVIIYLLKEFFGRLRPLHGIIVESGYAFPSGHSTIIVVFLGLLVYLFASKKNGWKMHLVAGLLVLVVGFTRLYLRVHWFTDVIAGYVVGLFILFVSVWVFEKFFV